jgi:hypothetical protein
MDRSSDAIKQGRLAVAAFGLAVKRARMGVATNVMKFPWLSIVGIEDQVLGDEEQEIKELVDRYAEREVNVNPLPFDSDRQRLFRRIAEANVAMMLSLHEGFGLTGWEAIAAEVPLILGENTGLYQLIHERLKGSGTGCLHPIDIEGLRSTQQGENFSQNDLDRVCDRLLQVAGDMDGHRQNAASLRSQLVNRLGCTWRHTARQFLEQIGIAINTGKIVQSLSSVIEADQLLPDEEQTDLGRYERFSWTVGKLSGQMIKVRSTSNDFDHSNLIRTARSVRIIMNDGVRFFQKYKDAFALRNEEAKSTMQHIVTEICILAPEGPHISIVARRSEKTAAEQSANISSSATLIKDIFRGSEHLGLYGMKDFFPYCLFQYDQTLLLSLYPAFERVEELPMLILSATGETSDIYYSIAENAERLFHRARVGQKKWFVSL